MKMNIAKLLMGIATLLSFISSSNCMAFGIDADADQIKAEVPALFQKNLEYYGLQDDLVLIPESISLRAPKNPIWWLAVVVAGAAWDRDRYSVYADVKNNRTGELSKFDCYLDVIPSHDPALPVEMVFFVTLGGITNGYSCNLTVGNNSVRLFDNVFLNAAHDFAPHK